MLKITLIIGLPGSSKSFLGNRLSQETGAHFLDDVKDEDEIDSAIANGHISLLIAHPFFCDSLIRDKLVSNLKEKYNNIEFEYIFFENDAKQCRENAKLRNRKVEGTLRRFENIYKIPDGYVPLPVWRPCNLIMEQV